MNVETIKSFLHQIPLFKELSNEELDAIVNITQLRKFKQRMLVFMQGDPLDRVFFIHSGKLKIYKTDLSGKEQIVSILRKGEMFPHVGFFRQGNYPAHAEIVEESTLFVISIKDFEKMLLQYPGVSIKLFKVMGEKIIDLQNRLEEKILHNTYEQIIMLLIRLGRKHGESAENGFVQLTTQFTNRELANMIGSTRETINRTLNQFKKKNLLIENELGFLIHVEKLKEELF
ncbi:Crp/Fnr family transcriptional regulator [Chengkuizengella axinellae]|uniref:Crp/Fnr family transcriptional regulator n=1 Tax=Chengkuizengella axinellae TaxID=3064388 RepID=A0ABT9IUI7_9BACL|nr:Crp/Fnr family transcriptional regulator [Chengkuizengella sp. 2205SS18-9]MDP5273023.1 Crp/Fnr family transcriptional regulator [Chengkuizengella sp. 2205SS18-9]